MNSKVKNFVSEKQIEEKRKARQEEWEKVRKPEDPVTAPEEEYDPRSLYERLQEQKDKKQEEFEEQLKFKNHFRGINTEESEFLSDVNKRSSELEKQKILEEKRELEDFKNAVSQSRELPEVDIDLPDVSTKTIPTKKPAVIKRNNQQSILKGAVKRKAESEAPDENDSNEKCTSEKLQKSDVLPVQKVIYPSVTKCVGILPGLAAYGDDSGDSGDDDSSSDDDGLISNNLLSSVIRNQE